MTGPKAVLCLTFDNMGYAVDVGRGLRAGPDTEEPSLVVGYPNILALLDRLQLRATFFIEGWNALHHPAAVRQLVARGHEVGVHGWTHEVFHSLDAIAAERVLVDALAAFRAIGVEPRGFRAPGGIRGDHTPEILKKLGLAYDSSVDAIPGPITPRLLDWDIPTVPWEWCMIDYYQYYMHPDGARTPAELELYWVEKLEQAAVESSLVTIILHAIVSGIEPDRLEAIHRLLDRARQDQRIEILTAGEVAARVVSGSLSGPER